MSVYTTKLDIYPALKANMVLTDIVILALVVMFLHNLYTSDWINAGTMFFIGISTIYVKVMLRKQLNTAMRSFAQKSASQNMLVQLLTTLSMCEPETYQIALRTHIEDFLNHPPEVIADYVMSLPSEVRQDLLQSCTELAIAVEQYREDQKPDSTEDTRVADTSLRLVKLVVALEN